MFASKKVKELKKTTKQEVDVSICYYHLEDGKDRYVFFFYDPTEKSPIYKWSYYHLDNDMKDFKKKYNEVLKDKNFKPNKLATLCMCNKSTKINTIKLPKTLKYSLNYKSIIVSDLKDKMGNDVKDIYFIDNKIEGVEEKKAESLEKKMLSKGNKRKAIVDKYKEKIAKEEFEYNFVEPKQKRSIFTVSNKVYLTGSFVMIAFSIFMVFSALEKFLPIYLTIPFVCLSLIFLTSIFFLEMCKTKQLKKGIKNEKKPMTYKRALDIYYGVATALFVYLSEVVFYYVYTEKVVDFLKNVYGTFVFLFLISIIVIERIKRKKLSELCVEIKHEKKVKEPKMIKYEEVDEDEEELFEGGMNENKLFNMSRSKVKIKKSKKAASVITYRQLLVTRDSYKRATKTMSALGFGIRTLRTLPSLIASFHRKHSKGVNEIIVYNEADFTLMVGFVNDQIVDSLFVEGNDRKRDSEGNIIGFQLSSFKNVFSSLLFSCQRETNNMDRVVFISNSPKKLDDFKKENIFGLPSETVASTDIVFGESVRKVKSLALLKAFTLIETVVAIAIFAITASMVATLTLAINRFNMNTNDTSKANVYVKNVTEVLNENFEDNTLEKITGFDFNEDTSKTGTYYVDYNFSVFDGSKKQSGKTYAIVFSIEKTIYSKSTSGIIQDYTDFVFTIKKINRIDSKKDLISLTRIEVVK